MSRKARKHVGLIGLGIIGARAAAGLRAAGYQVYVWNRSAKPVPNFLGSPAEIADAAEIIQIFVSDAGALFEVIEAMGDSLTPRHVIVCSATVGPEAVLEASQTVQARGAQFLDAPFTGSKIAAEKRELVYYVGGSEATYLKVRPVLEATSKSIIRVGEVGHAATVKVVTNMISAVTVQVLAEALSIVQKAGLEPEVLAAAIEQNACRSGVLDLKLPKMIAGDYDPHFSLKHMFKDVQLGIHMANALDLEVPVTTVTAGVMYGALNKGWGEQDFSALFKNYAPAETLGPMPALLAPEPLSEEKVHEIEMRSAEISIEGAVTKTLPGVGTPESSVANKAPEDASTPRQDLVESLEEINALAPLIANLPAECSASGNTSALPNGAETPAAEVSKDSDKLAPLAIDDDGKIAQSDSPDRGDDEATLKIEGLRDDNATSEALGAKALDDGNEGTIRPNNFVRRWFVARSGS